MKKYIVIIFMSLTSMLCSAQIIQTITINDFIGTWQYQDENNIFRIILVESFNGDLNDDLDGKFQLIEIQNGVEVITFDSGYIGDTDYFPQWIAITGRIWDINKFSGMVEDRSNPGYGALDGRLETELIDNNGILQLTWKVTKRGLRDTEEPDFNIPTDAVLTKVE
jgi:hypothetical protein